MARFTSVKVINSRWRNNDFIGAANSSHTFPDAFYDEFLVDWAQQIADGSIIITETPTTGNIQVASLTVGDIVLTGSATGNFGASAAGVSSISGTAPIAVSASTGAVTVSLNANYQTAGTYITAVNGTSPISVSTNTANASTVSIDQTLLSAAAATSALNLRTLVRNTTASTIAKGSFVYLASSNGVVPTVEKALATSDATSARTFGVVEADIAANSNGYVLNQGVMDPIDTSGIAAGSVLWLSSTVAGGYTTVKPVGPNHGVLLGVCVKGTSVGNGSIYVFIKNGAELDEIHDVNISSQTDGQALIWSASQSVWVNQSLATASTTGYGYTTLVDSVTSTSTTTAATANAARIANAAGTAAQVTANAATASAASKVASVTGDAAISSTGTTAISLAHTTTDGYHHVPATSTTNSGKFLKAGALAGSEAWANIAMSDVTTGNYVSTVAAGTGVTVTGADANAATKTIAIGQAVATNSNVTFADIIANNITANGLITGSKTSGTLNVGNGIILVRSTSQSITTTTIPTAPTTTNTQALSWSSALKANTSWWTTGSQITLPLSGMYQVTLALTGGSGTSYALAAYLFQGSTLRYHTEVQATANGQYDILNISGMIYTTAANETIQIGLAASTTTKSIVVTPRNGILAVTYLGSF